MIIIMENHLEKVEDILLNSQQEVISVKKKLKLLSDNM